MKSAQGGVPVAEGGKGQFLDRDKNYLDNNTPI